MSSWKAIALWPAKEDNVNVINRCSSIVFDTEQDAIDYAYTKEFKELVVDTSVKYIQQMNSFSSADFYVCYTYNINIDKYFELYKQKW